MDIIEFALKMETDGKNFYLESAAATDDPLLKDVLSSLAEEEDRHYRFFKRLQANPEDYGATEILGGSQTLSKVQNIFEDMSQAKDKSFGNSVVAVWTEAMRIEEKAEAFYREKAAAEPDARKKKLLERIAQEEYNHVKMIDGVLMYVKDPATFAESAQFKNFRSLEGL